jgi:hypothetical protein
VSEILAVPTEIPPFVEFPSIARLARECIVTEKIDGTNAQVHITEDGRMFAGSRSRWITPLADNFGFAAWVQANRDELMLLGPGSHFGEWWGSGIQRGYGLTNGEKRFALFNVSRWADDAVRPTCCGVVPTLARMAEFDTQYIEKVMFDLGESGSRLAPGFMKPEGIVVYHEKSRTLFKRTFGGDGHKGAR